MLMWPYFMTQVMLSVISNTSSQPRLEDQKKEDENVEEDPMSLSRPVKKAS